MPSERSERVLTSKLLALDSKARGNGCCLVGEQRLDATFYDWKKACFAMRFARSRGVTLMYRRKVDSFVCPVMAIMSMVSEPARYALVAKERLAV